MAHIAWGCLPKENLSGSASKSRSALDDHLPAALVRKQGLNDRPLKIGQFVAPWGHDRSSTELESHPSPQRNAIYEFVA